MPFSVVSTVIELSFVKSDSMPVMFIMVFFKILNGSLKKSSKVFKMLVFIYVNSIKKHYFFV